MIELTFTGFIIVFALAVVVVCKQMNRLDHDGFY